MHSCNAAYIVYKHALLLDVQHFLNHVNFIKLRDYDSLLVNTPDKLFVNCSVTSQNTVDLAT